MDLRALRYIVTIAEKQNLTKAAEALYVSQPTLSKSLAALEAELGVKLFQRIRRKYIPTYAGERYTDWAAQILRMKDGMDEEMKEILEQDVGTLNVAFPGMRSSYMLPCVLPAFQKMYPNVRVQVFEGSSTENDNRLLNGAVDLAFYSMPRDTGSLTPAVRHTSQIEYITLAREELLICTCAHHRLGQYALPNPDSPWPKLPLGRLNDERVILMQPEQRTRQIVDMTLAESGIHYDNVIYSSNLHAILGLVASGYGVSFVMDTHLKHWGDVSRIDRYSFDSPRVMCDFVAAKRRGGYLSRYAQDFIKTVKQYV